jgi:hypothetical protein
MEDPLSPPSGGSVAIPRRPIRPDGGLDPLSRDFAHQPENSLGNAIHVAYSAVLSAAGFAVVGAVGASCALVAVPRVSREMRLLAPSVSAAIAAILGAQQGTLQALASIQPTASFALLRKDLDEALARDAQDNAARGGGREQTYVIREHRSWLMGRDRPAGSDRTELLVHSNTVDREAVARHLARSTAPPPPVARGQGETRLAPVSADLDGLPLAPVPPAQSQKERPSF